VADNRKLKKWLTPQKKCTGCTLGVAKALQWLFKTRALRPKMRSKPMLYYAGLDVSMKETSIAIVDEKGKIAFETMCETDPDTIATVLKDSGMGLEKVGIESGCISFWLIDELKQRALKAICIESRQMATIIALKVNKTDRNDARLIANAMRCDLYKEVHPKTKESIEVNLQMNARRTLIKIRTQLKNSIRGYLKAFGVRLGARSHQKFSMAVKCSIKGFEDVVQVAIEGLLKSYEEVCRNIESADNELEKLCIKDPVIELFRSIPGVGIITAVTYKAVIDNPKRFENPRNIGAYLGLTPNQYSSGDTVKQGCISKCGNSELRNLLVECATVILTRTKVWTKLKAWGLKIMKRSGIKKAAAAVARKLAIIMLRMWQEGKAFIWGERKEKLKEIVA
jgi:transposase